MPGNLYDAYNPFAGTQRNIGTFMDLYERKQQRGLQERGLGLEERRMSLVERGQGVDEAYKQMLINKETEELKMKQDLMSDPGTRISIMSKALKEAYATGGKKMADMTLKSFQSNPKYQDDTKNYTIDDFQFTKGGGMYAPIITTEGQRLEGMYGFIDPQGQMHELDMRPKQGSKPSSVEEYEFAKQLPPEERAKYEKFATKPLVQMGEAEKEEQKAMGKLRIESYQKLQSDADAARTELDMYDALKELSGKTKTGALEPMKTQIAAYAQSLGVPISPRWSANQAYEAISNKLTVMARKVGEGQMLAGQISDSDREFLKRSVPELTKTPESNQMLIGWNSKLAGRRIELANLADEYYNENGTMNGFNKVKKDWIEQNPLFENQESVERQTITATNPKTGQKVKSNDGGKTWQLIQ